MWAQSNPVLLHKMAFQWFWLELTVGLPCQYNFFPAVYEKCKTATALGHSQEIQNLELITYLGCWLSGGKTGVGMIDPSSAVSFGGSNLWLMTAGWYPPTWALTVAVGWATNMVLTSVTVGKRNKSLVQCTNANFPLDIALIPQLWAFSISNPANTLYKVHCSGEIK